MMRLVVDNTRPDLLAWRAANDDQPMPVAELAWSFGRALNRLAWLAFWIALGLAAGVAL